MKIRLQILSLFSLLLFIACEKPVEQTASESTNQEVQTATLPSPPLVTLEYLWENCDYVDYVFYELPFSMSLQEPAAIKNAISHFASDPAPMKPGCKPIGRLFFQVKGENIIETDMYFSEGCTYFVFIEDQKPKYSAYMTPEAVQFMNNNLAQVNQMRQNNQ